MPLMKQGMACALVRWAPQACFNPTRHFGGEEVCLVDGGFEDAHGRYPAGWRMDQKSPHARAPILQQKSAARYL